MYFAVRAVAEKEVTQHERKCCGEYVCWCSTVAEAGRFLLDKNSIVNDIGHLFVAFRTKIPQKKT